jgi:uncharacterized repeat protein (TIGR01451 family)
MSFYSKLRMVAVLVAALVVTGARAEAQAGFGLLVTNSASSILISNSLTYTITVTNLVGVLSDTVVSNTLTPSAQFVSATPSSIGASIGTVTNFGNVTVFHLFGSIFGDVAKMTLTVRPTAAGLITNMVVVSVPSIFVTNTAATNMVTQVTNTVLPQADLGVAITVPTTAIIVNDLMAYGVSVTNAGPSAASNVMLTNTLPAGVILKGSYTVVSNNVIFNLGTLKSGGFANFQFTIQPTNAGALNFFASVGASGVVDTNLVNNTASNNITVLNYLSGDLVAVTNSAQNVNHQNGLIEQSILVSNIGTNAVTAVRVVVTSLTNRLFNAVGTNSGSPFVVYTAPLATPLAPSTSVTLLLQYAPRKNFPFTNSQLHAFAVPPPDLTPPAATTTGTNLTITRFVRLTNGNMLVEFPAITNRTYTMVYSDNVLFSNAMIAPPSFVAPANIVQWIDYGPPATVSAPSSSSSSRFYRVYLNP